MQANDLSEDLPTNPPERSAPAADRPAQIRLEYRDATACPRAAANLLGVVRFGGEAKPTEAFAIDVQLEVLRGPTAELWFANGPVRSGRAGLVRYAHDDHFLLAAIEEDERAYGGIAAVTEIAYGAVRQFQQQCPFPHLLRMWNYLDAINDGPGDLERYRQFCAGRGRGMGGAAAERYPAATAIGRQRPTGRLQVLWLAARIPGIAMENPRQVSAYRYPRTHGPVSPSFSRATLASDHTVLISGTASIVGHVSQHPQDPLAQLEETLRNLAALTANASGRQNAARHRDLLKVYLRDPLLLEPVAARLKQTHPDSQAIFVAGDVCRSELLLEIECVRTQYVAPA